MSAKKLYAFPISKVFHLDLAGEEHFLGLRFRWNTGETEIAWDQPGTFKMALIFEEPIPCAATPLVKQRDIAGGDFGGSGSRA